MRKLGVFTGAWMAATLLASGGAMAQVVGLGTAQAGATVQYGTAIAKIVSENAGLQMRTQGLASTNQYAARINAGELEFGLSNIIEATFALSGGGFFDGRAHPNLRMAFTLFPLPITFFVKESSGITTYDQLAGAKTPTGWSSQKLGEYIFRGFFANIDKSYDSVRGVPIAAMPRMWDLYGQGELDFAFAILNNPTTRELMTKVKARSISVSDDPAAVERMQKYLPSSYVTTDRNVDTGEMVKNIAFDFVVFVGAHVSDDVVYKVVKAVHQASDQLRSFETNSPPNMVSKTELEYHPGAIRYYKEVGLWPPKD